MMHEWSRRYGRLTRHSPWSLVPTKAIVLLLGRRRNEHRPLRMPGLESRGLAASQRRNGAISLDHLPPSSSVTSPRSDPKASSRWLSERRRISDSGRRQGRCAPALKHNAVRNDQNIAGSNSSKKTSWSGNIDQIVCGRCDTRKAKFANCSPWAGKHSGGGGTRSPLSPCARATVLHSRLAIW
jgi:hypothetical protein